MWLKHELRWFICNSEHTTCHPYLHLKKMCSRLISVALEGACSIFHPCGVCITWLPYFSVAGTENQLRKSPLRVGEGKMRNCRATSWRVLSRSAHRSCLAARRAEISFFFLSGQLKLCWGNCTVTPHAKLGERDHSSKIKWWAGGRAWKTIVHVRHWTGTYIKWHSGWVAIDFSAKRSRLLLQSGFF